MKNSFILLFIIVLISCNKTNNKSIAKPVNYSQKDTIYNLTESKVNSEGAYLFSNNSKKIINWTEWYKNSKKNILKFAFFDDLTKTFGKEITVNPSLGLQMHAESMAKIGITNKGIFYAIYRKKSTNPKFRFAGTIYYSISKDNGATWSDGKKLVSDKSSTSQSFFDIALLPDGELGIVWLDSRKPIDKNHKGKTLYFAKTKLDKGFVNEKPIAGSTCECCRTDFFIDKNNTIYIAYRNLIDPKEELFDNNGTVEIRDMYYVTSVDNGKTFTKSQPISRDNWHINGCPHTGPSLAFDGQKVAAVWFTAANNEEGIYYAYNVNGKFNTRKQLTSAGHHPQMIALQNEFYVVYEEYYEQNDKGYDKIVLETINDFSTKNVKEISKKKTTNNHAVITSINNTNILIAWVNTDTRNPKIMYRIL